jgi:pyrimidine operon attenuation protein/uracil phosphoribosyltransferase
MTVTLHGLCYYRAKSDEWDEKWNNNHYAALNFVKAIKGGTFKGYSEISANSKTYTIRDNAEGRAVAYGLAALGLANKIRSAGCTNAAIIPIPSSSHTDPCATFTGRKLAEAVKQKIPTLEVRSDLYFAQAMPKSAQGGGRNPNTILGNLRSRDLSDVETAILIDDVYTSGAHIKAATRYLRNKGIEVEHAFVVARTAWEKPNSMFSVESETVHFI